MKRFFMHTAVLFIIAVFLIPAYSPVLKGDFIYDDIPFIVTNPAIKDFSNVWGFFDDPETVSPDGRHHLWRPLRTLSFAVDYRFWGLDSAGYHIVNIVLHGLNAFCIYLLGLHMFSLFESNKKTQFLMSVSAAVLFAITPVHTEAVSWISSRSDSLYSFLVLLSILFYAKSRRIDSKRVFYFISLFSFILALLSKESAFMLPALLVLYDAAFASFSWVPFKKNLRGYMPFLAVACCYMLLRYRILGEVGQSGYIGGTFLKTVFTMFAVLLSYLRLLIWPTGLRLFYDIHPVDGFLQAGVIGGIFVLYLLVFLSWMFRKSFPFLGFCVGWFFINLFPASNIVPMKGWMGERLIYLSSAGFFLLFVFILWRLLEKMHLRKKLAYTVFLVVVMFFVNFYFSETTKRNRVWADEITFWKDAVRTGPQIANSWHNLGIILVARGYYNQAEEVLRKTLSIDPDDRYAYYGIAYIYYIKKDIADAKEWILTAIDKSPENADAYSLAGVIFAETGDFAKSLQYHKKAINLNPSSAPILYNAGLAYQEMGLISDAIALFEKAVAIKPDFARARNSLGAAYKNIGKFEQACIQLKKAIVLKPGFASAYNNLGICLSALDRQEEAKKMFFKARSLDRNGSVGVVASENLRLLGERLGN